MQIKGIHIPADEQRPVRLVEIDREDVHAIQQYVGGMFQCLDTERPFATIFCDDEGKINESPANRRATLFLWVHNAQFRFADVIAGDVLLLGQPDCQGHTQEVPAELVSLLFDTKEYRYLVHTHADQEDVWTGNGLRYQDWVSAYNDAIALTDRWSMVKDVKIVSSQS